MSDLGKTVGNHRKDTKKNQGGSIEDREYDRVSRERQTEFPDGKTNFNYIQVRRGFSLSK